MAFPNAVYTDNESAGAALTNNAAAAGLTVTGLQPVAQLQSVVANLLVDAPSVVDVPAGDVLSGTFGANVTPADTGVYNFPSMVGIGVAGSASRGLIVGGTVTAASAAARGIASTATLVASANNDILTGIRADPAFTPGALTGLTAVGLAAGAFSVATFTSPGDPIGVNIGIITGTGATNAFGVRIAPPTGATNNYLISHTTPATFNVKDSGAVTSASTLAIGGAFTGATTIAASTSVTVTSASAVALTVGLAGATNPAFSVDSSTASQAAGLKVTGAATGGTVAIVATDSGAATNVTINAKGTGTIGIGTVSTGAVTITPAITTAGVLTVNAASQLGTAAGTDVTTIGGTGYGAGAASIRLNGLTTAAVNNQVGTLTNAPSAGNPVFWIPVNIAGSVRYIPAWS